MGAGAGLSASWRSLCTNQQGAIEGDSIIGALVRNAVTIRRRNSRSSCSNLQHVTDIQ
jgi:hypothetical protein